MVEDPQPWWGSEFDKTVVGREPAGSPGKEWYKSNNIASNLTFATLPLTFMGGWINWFTDQDRNPAFDLPDVTKDIPYIGALGRRAGAMAVVPERLRSRADRRRKRSLAPELRQPP